MRIIKICLIFAAFLVIAACQSEAPAETPVPVFTESVPQPDVDALIAGESMSGCTLQTLIRPPDENELSLFKPLSDSDWMTGPDDAAVSIVHYSDFQCPECAGLSRILNQVQANFPDDVNLVYRQYPQLDQSDKAALTVAASEFAGENGLFWEMHDLLFGRQADWANLPEAEFKTWITERAGELGLDRTDFAAALEDPAYAEQAQAAYDEGTSLGIPGTPFLLVNGRIYDGPTDYDNLSVIVRLFALQEMQYSTCPPVVIDVDADYTATIVTEKGSIVVELFPDLAPRAVNNFVYLAQNGWFDGITFHRVLADYIAQAGDPSGTGFGGPGYAFVNENPNAVFDSAGLLAMANSGPDTNGSQFFITYAPAPNLNGGYTIFGRVIEGMGVAQGITPRDPSQGINLPPGDRITTITIQEN